MESRRINCFILTDVSFKREKAVMRERLETEARERERGSGKLEREIEVGVEECVMGGERVSTGRSYK